MIYPQGSRAAEQFLLPAEINLRRLTHENWPTNIGLRKMTHENQPMKIDTRKLTNENWDP